MTLSFNAQAVWELLQSNASVVGIATVSSRDLHRSGLSYEESREALAELRTEGMLVHRYGKDRYVLNLFALGGERGK